MRKLCAWMVCGLLLAAPVFGQQAETKAKSWEEAAGGRMSFEVASVRPTEATHFPSVDLTPDDAFRDPHGWFEAGAPVKYYIVFAYKMWMTGAERRAFEDSLPGWAKTQRYAIQARAPLGATKNQYRLMVQDLLAERFGLRLHIEQRDEPVLLMTLEKPGHPGPMLTPHDKGVPCDTAKPPADLFPPVCYLMWVGGQDGKPRSGARAVPLDTLGRILSEVGSRSLLDRTVVDETGLTGLWDYSLTLGSPHADGEPPNGPTFLEGIHDQLGLKLKPGRRAEPVLIVDHVDRPSEN